MALKELSTHCDFGSDFGDFLNDALRDRLVCGLYKESIQKRLLAEAELTFKKACEISQAMEMAEKNASELNTESTKAVNALQKSSGGKPKKNPDATPKSKRQYYDRNCYRCGGSHSPASCRFKSEKC